LTDSRNAGTLLTISEGRKGRHHAAKRETPGIGGQHIYGVVVFIMVLCYYLSLKAEKDRLPASE
jgi:hypothetical protein